MPDNREGSTWNRKPAFSGSLKRLPAIPKYLENRGNIARVQTVSDVNTIARYANGTEWNILKLVADKPNILRMLGGEVTFIWVRGEEERGNDLPAYVSSPTMLRWYHAGEKITKMQFKNFDPSLEAPGEEGWHGQYRRATSNIKNPNLQAPAAARKMGTPAGAPKGAGHLLNTRNVSSLENFLNIAGVRGESKNDPDSIAKLLSDDINTNNGFLYEWVTPFMDPSFNALKSTVDGFECLSLRDQDWNEAEMIVKIAWDQGYRYFNIDDGVQLFKEPNHLTNKAAQDYDCSPEDGLEVLLDTLRRDWFFD